MKTKKQFLRPRCKIAVKNLNKKLNNLAQVRPHKGRCSKIDACISAKSFCAGRKISHTEYYFRLNVLHTANWGLNQILWNRPNFWLVWSSGFSPKDTI